jgi:hypothetical protein
LSRLAFSSSQHAQRAFGVVDRPMLFARTRLRLPQLFGSLFNSFGRNLNSMMECFSQANFKVTNPSVLRILLENTRPTKKGWKYDIRRRSVT